MESELADPRDRFRPHHELHTKFESANNTRPSNCFEGLDAHLISLFVTLWDNDNVHRDVPLELAWCEFEANSHERTKRFLHVERPRRLNHGNQQHRLRADLNARSEEVSLNDMSVRLKELVDSIPSGIKDLTIILVYNWERTSQVIRKAYGSDDCPIDRWKTGPLDQSVVSLRQASRRSHSPESKPRYPNASSDRYDRGYTVNRYSSHGSADYGRYSSSHDPGSRGHRAYSSQARRYDTPAPITLPPAVYVIDVAEFSNFCLQDATVDPNNAYDSDLKTMLQSHWGKLKIESPNGWCAANECWSIIQLWKRLASGQFEEKTQTRKQAKRRGPMFYWTASPQTIGESAVKPSTDSVAPSVVVASSSIIPSSSHALPPEDYDAITELIAHSTNHPPAQVPKARNIMDLDSDDDDDSDY